MEPSSAGLHVTKKVLNVVGAILLLALLPMFLLAIVFSSRVLFLVAVVVLPVALLAAAVSPRARAWASDPDAGTGRTQTGLRPPAGLLVHPHHSWVRESTGGRALVGADDLLLRTLGPVEEAILPALGDPVRRGGPMFTLRRGDRTVVVRAPISGTVTSTNSRLLEQPELISTSPYVQGWAVQLQPTDLAADRAHLRHGEELDRWFRGEIDNLLACATSTVGGDPTLNDGGTIVEAFHNEVSDSTWERIRCLFFGQAA